MNPRRIKLIVTGDLEKQALPRSLSQAFPARDRRGRPILWLPAQRVDSGTTRRLYEDRPPNTAMRRLATALVAEVIDGADGTPADLVLAVDDLELHNFGQAPVVRAQFRAAVSAAADARLAGLDADAAMAHRARLRDRGAFHLLSPMVEAYFFGGEAALRSAGVGPQTTPMLASAAWEDFWCTDPAHLPACTAENERKAAEAPWWRAERHAKAYLGHLVARSGGTYRETVGGAQALAALDWRGSVGVAGCPLAHALLSDIADFIDATPLGPPTAAERILRNL